jgi:hypothetical protein
VRGRARATLETTTLLAVGAMLVHELRYRIALGDDATSALAASGHTYLGVITPVVALAAMFGVARLVHRIGSGDGSTLRRRTMIWLALAGGLFGVFCLQELFEALLASGQPEGLDGMLADGGWLAIPLSLGIAGLAVALVRLAAANVFRGVATAFARLRPLEATVINRPLEAPRKRPPLRGRLAARAPPLFA